MTTITVGPPVRVDTIPPVSNDLAQTASPSINFFFTQSPKQYYPDNKISRQTTLEIFVLSTVLIVIGLFIFLTGK